MLAQRLLRREAAIMAKCGETPQIGTSAFNPAALLQTFLTNLILLLSVGLFSRGEWGPALIVLFVYVVTLVFNASGGPVHENDEQVPNYAVNRR